MKIKDILKEDNHYTKEEINNILNSFNKKEKPWFEKYILPSIIDKNDSLPLRKIKEIKTTCTQKENTYENYPTFKNIYHIIYHPQTLLRAYSNLSKNKGGSLRSPQGRNDAFGALTAGIDLKTLDGFSMKHTISTMNSKNKHINQHP